MAGLEKKEDVFGCSSGVNVQNGGAWYFSE
jgi:hypothetical protein